VLPLSRLGTWTFSVAPEHLSWSSAVRALHDVPVDFEPTAARAMDFVAPVFRGGLRDALKACLRDGQPFDMALQIQSACGERRALRVTGEAQRDYTGRVVRIEGACHELTQSQPSAADESAREALDALRTSNMLLREQLRDQRVQLDVVHDDLKAISDSIAHDLRAPLSSIDGFGHLLHQEAGPSLGDRGRHALARIRAGCRQMGDLTEGLLALASLTRGGLRREPTELAVLARGAAEALRERFPSRRVDIDIAETMPATVDPRWFAQVFAHLIGNAWKFTAVQPQGRIEIGCTAGAGELVYFVRDNGAGFDMARASKLFAPFHRLHTLAEFEGIGIGLAIVQKIVARHGGRIWAQAAPGGGACFYFTVGTGTTPDPLLLRG
jgi:light-regulated signal transduction histidine kinase (bacteriophytochrome)